jgi:hypothetical protein
MKAFMLATLLILSQTIFGFDGQVVNNEQGVYLLINDTWLKTEGVQIIKEDAFALMEGEWMTLEEALTLGDYQAAWKCSNCKRYNMDGVNICPYCGKRKNA